MRYIEQLYNIQNPSFNSIIELNASLVPLQYRSRPWQYPGLNHGTAVLTTEEQCNAYIAAYGNMHQGKINEVLDEIKINDFANTDLQIIDWGCGQGLATICLFDFFNKHNLSLDLVKKVVLIEPSEVARDRAKTHVNAYLRDEDKIVVIGKYIDDVKVDDIVSDEPVTLHLFSNILDIPSIDLLRLANSIKTSLKGLHYFFCWGPLNQGNNRIDSFWSYFNEADSVFFNTHNKQEYNAEGKLIKTYSYTAKNRVFKVNGDECELIFVDYYQPKQFHAAYQLDAVCKALKSVDKNKLDGLHKNISDFEVQTPFDIGASIYEDVHPILAVLNNIITRGLPTKASPFLESAFADLGNQLLEDRLGGIAYDINGLNGEDLFLAMHLIDPRWQKSFDSSWTNVLQLVLSPVAVARLEKTILEALMTRVLNISATRWKVLVKEHDVPCAALAFEELREMFKHITQLSAEYSDLKFPEVELTIVSTKEFAQSSLHLNHRVLVGEYHSNAEYDMVIDFAMLRRNGLEDIDFTDYKCKNKCYFNVRSAHHHRNDRQIYTSDRILYKQIATQNNQGRYEDIEDNVKHLRYFLRMLFRKQDFRPGQIPILNRALQYKSVIGLLPTGGGKSLIYQIAAMLQPGVTLVIDPLRSLMKDQYDGLIGAGIDCCSYINSSIEVPEAIKAKGAKEIQDYRIKERERRSKCLEQSEFLFMFLSPERLSILNFRERLKNMQETGVYFAYGVIDEVHCVSEWGHDFRFSYLHLGRNLYRYVLPKPKEGDEKENHIPLFGLTATASFDVLADVERELSGNGAFPLDAETVVREGDTNRFEIQYKIEPVPVSFTLKQADGTVKPNKWAIFDSKKDFLDSLISQMPFYLNELLTEQSIQTITDGYTIGPRADGRELKSLQTDIPSDFLSAQDVYDYGGIVFCPHKDHTGVAVFTNQFELTTKHPNAKIGTFVGSGDGIALHHVEESFKNLELFRDNKLSLMIATKAFGMGIDKPNVRFTINMNYSSSLESFVQEAGRAGRDQRMALSVIMLSKYRIARVKPGTQFFKANIYKWYDANDIEEIAQKKGIPVEDFEICDETSDLVKLKCKQCGDSCKRFENNCCSFACNHCDKPQKYESFKSVCAQKCEYYDTCELAKVPTVDKWSRYEHLSVYKERYPFITCENYEFLNADYETVMFFYNNNFKGENHEKLKMHQLLSKLSMKVTVGGQNEDEKTIHGFLATLQSVRVGTKEISYIPYTKGEYDDIAKAIYRMCCIDLIDDFTQDYNSKCFRIVSYKKSDGQYYAALEKYLRRYYTVERAAELVSEVPSYKGENEIHKCLGFLTHFIYDKIAVKRKRAIDDMFAFCVHGVDANKDWKAINEELKDELYFYFNSKYARREYRTERGEQFSLLVDTDEGKRSSWETVLKFMQVVDNQWISKNSEAGSTQNDNAKHLYGAVRLIRRDAKEINPTIDLLGAFCLMFLGTNNNHLLQKELEDLYISGMKEFYRQNDRILFWEHIFEVFNNNPNVSAYFANNGGLLKSAAMLEIHKYELSNIKNNYIK
ncbi:MAG TPA: recombinase RecQ [Bacteroides sp.]|nr:recombinase RecQ [Bacteroides sp.]